MSENSHMTITEFLQARIADDERDAKKLAETDRRPVLSLASTVNHPQRLLAECAAKRAIIGEYTGSPATFQIMAHMAAVYSDHPDYQQEWAS